MTITEAIKFEAIMCNTEWPTEPMRGYWPDMEGWSAKDSSQPKDSWLWSLTPVVDGLMPPIHWVVMQTGMCGNILMKSYVKDFLQTSNDSSCVVSHAEFSGPQQQSVMTFGYWRLPVHHGYLLYALVLELRIYKSKQS